MECRGDSGAVVGHYLGEYWRERAGLSRHALAKAAGVRQHTVAAAEAGKVPHLRTVERVAGALGLDPSKVWQWREPVAVAGGKRGRTFREAREAAGLTIGELASALGVSRQAVSKAEISRAVPPPETVVRYAEAIGCRCEDLWSWRVGGE